jgi:ribosomal protein S18 acetylase RimI-like enzyme
MNIQLEIRTESDSGFFMELFGEIKSSELLLNTWPEQIRHQMITMQFQAFEQSIITEFPGSIDFLILFNSVKAGRLQINKDEKEIRIINISLLPAFRNKGIGSKILNNIIIEASHTPVFLEVDKTNPAQKLYSRLGFKIVQQNEIKYLMKYTPVTHTCTSL